MVNFQTKADADANAPANAETGEDKQSPTSKKKGKGAKSRQAERFREKKNKEFGAALDKKIEEFKISLGYKPEELFGTRQINPVIKPQLEVPVSTQIIGEICDTTAEVLHTACKVPPAPGVTPQEAIQYDAETLKFATALQLEAKFFNGRKGSEYLVDVHNERLVQRVCNLLSDALIPISVYLDQVGRFSIDGQIFIPATSGHAFVYSKLGDIANIARDDFACFRDNPDPAPEGSIPINVVGINGGQMHVVIPPDSVQLAAQRGLILQVREGDVLNIQNYGLNPAFIQNPNAFQWFGVIQMTEVMPQRVMLQFDQVVTRYTELRGRVNKKLRDVFVDVKLVNGEGTESQLVNTTDIGGSEVTAWAFRNVKEDALMFGALLQLGVPGPQSAEQVKAVETVIDTAGAIQMLANVLTKRLR